MTGESKKNEAETIQTRHGFSDKLIVYAKKLKKEPPTPQPKKEKNNKEKPRKE